MGDITVVPVWIIQDIMVLIAAVLMVFYILDKEEHPKTVLMQFIGFVFFTQLFLKLLRHLLGKVSTPMGGVF